MPALTKGRALLGKQAGDGARHRRRLILAWLGLPREHSLRL